MTLLTQPDCTLCEQAKEVLRRVQTDPTIGVRLVVEEVSLTSETGRALAAEAGVLFAPGVLLAGKPLSHGRLSERKLRKALHSSHDVVQSTPGHR